MSGLLTELKRRKVFKVSAMYLVAAWLLVQIGSVVFEPLGMPQQSLRVLIIACAAGFPIAIALGWVFDWTSQGIVRTSSHSNQSKKRGANYPLILGSIASLLIIALGYGGYRGYDFWLKVQWAQTVAQPTLTEHIKVNDFAAAFKVASEIEDALGPTPALDAVWDLIAAEVSFTTEPSGATVSYRRYDQPDGPWTVLGTTPIRKTLMPVSPTVWQIKKDGYKSRIFARVPNKDSKDFIWPSHYQLDLENTVPANTVTLEANSRAFVPLSSVSLGKQFNIGRFHIDRTEVSNKDYQEFVDAGAYQQKQYWTEEFADDHTNLNFTEAMGRFTDATGRPGPATWIAGRYPDGKVDHPVTGVSWYEAAAYARFRGRHLPTIYHWAYAALPDTEIIRPIAPSMAAQSNLESEGTMPVGTTDAISAAGAKDMFGNVAEWAWNKYNDTRRFSLGLGWSDPAYNATIPSRVSPWSRLETQGFRLMSYDSGEADSSLTQAISTQSIDIEKINPVSDEAYNLLVSSNTHTLTDIRATETKVDLPNGDSAIRVEIDYPTSDEKLPLYLLVPENAKPPYQTLIWMGGVNALGSETNDSLFEFDMKATKFLVQSGRLIVMPIWTDTFERNTRGFGPQSFQTQSIARELLRNWKKDFSYVLDYLQTREDVSSEQLGLMALSMGALSSPYLLMSEPRIKSNILWSGGFLLRREGNFQEANLLAGVVQRISAPTLMLNGQYDYIISHNSQQKLFDLLGTNPADKKHVVFDTGHFGWPIGEFVKENLDWLDTYLGPVERE